MSIDLLYKKKKVHLFLTNNALLVDLPQLWCLQARVKRAFGKKVELLKKSSALGLAARCNYSSLAGSVVSAAATICRYRFFPTYNDTLPREREEKNSRLKHETKCHYPFIAISTRGWGWAGGGGGVGGRIGRREEVWVGERCGVERFITLQITIRLFFCP